MTKYKEIIKYRSLGYSMRQIADILNVSRNTISKTYTICDSYDIDWVKASKMTEDELASTISPKKTRDTIQTPPDTEYIFKELQRPGVTLKLLWEEYVEQCRMNNQFSLQYSQFCNHYRQYSKQSKATMHFDHLPGKRIEVDWCGKYIPIYNEYGEVTKGYVFVGTLPYSQYSYVEVTENMKEENWITAHVNMFQFFKGVTPIIYPDNLKTGVISHPKNGDVILNKSYEELGNYYNVAIVPTLPRSPKGKPSVEGTVGKITTHIIGRLRNHKFKSVYEANKFVLQELEKFNNKNFQKREGSRKSVFENEEQHTLLPLPPQAYEYAQRKQCTVQFNYHVSIDKNYYSVPYEYIQYKVDARITKRIIEIYYQGKRLCSHSRLYGRKNQYSTSIHHMPPKHKESLEWNGERLRNWAKKIGPRTFEVIDCLLKSYKVEQQGYTGCRSLLKLSDKYTNKELEKACLTALKHSKRQI